MYIEKLDPQRILIALSSDDITIFSSSRDHIELSDDNSLRLFSSLIELAAVGCGLPTKGRKFKLELLCGTDTFFIILTLVSSTAFLPMGNRRIICARFDNASDLTECIERISNNNYCLYKYKGLYFLCADHSSYISSIISEYGTPLHADQKMMLYLDEFAKHIK